ncbi:MAG: hypothetical protein JO257_05290 [Deltaproteobacteria bacterium]|nr:hypothetical protein [Deltaproteobacteria bacterium]
MRWVVVVALACGCSSSHAPATSPDATGSMNDASLGPWPIPWESGSRLRARIFTDNAPSLDGTHLRALAGWHDNQTGSDCAFDPATATFPGCMWPTDDAPITSDHHYGETHYSALETADGFSVIVDHDPPSTSAWDVTATTRLTELYDANGHVWRAAGIYDTKYKYACTPTDVGGSLRCMPATTPGTPTGTCWVNQACGRGDAERTLAAPGAYTSGSTIYACWEPCYRFSGIGAGGTCALVPDGVACADVTNDIAPMTIAVE